MSTKQQLQWTVFRAASPRMRAALEVQSPFQLLGMITIAPSKEYAFFANPKVGSSTIRRALLTHEAPELLEGDSLKLSGRDPFVRLTDLSRTRPLEALVESGVPKVAMVRNPFTRAISAFQSKIASPSDMRDLALDKLRLPRRPVGEVRFDEFVRSMCAQTDREMDPHWRVQTSQILADVVELDFVGRFEDFDDDFARMMAMCGVIGYDSANRNAHPRAARVEEYFTDDLTELFVRRFRTDFETFGYDTDPTAAN